MGEMGSGEGEGGLFLRFRLVYILILSFLQSPPSKDQFKNLTKAHILSYWEVQLRAEASLLPSLVYFHPQTVDYCRKEHIY